MSSSSVFKRVLIWLRTVYMLVKYLPSLEVQLLRLVKKVGSVVSFSAYTKIGYF